MVWDYYKEIVFDGWGFGPQATLPMRERPMGETSHRALAGIAAVIFVLLVISLVGVYPDAARFWPMIAASVVACASASVGAVGIMQLRRRALERPTSGSDHSRHRVVFVAPLVLLSVGLVRLLPESQHLVVAAAGMGILIGFCGTVSVMIRASADRGPGLAVEFDSAWREADRMRRATALLGIIAFVALAAAAVWLVLQGHG